MSAVVGRRLDLAVEARELREAGFLVQEVADLLGISRSYASELLLDPDGSRNRARKRSYGGTCEDCGARTDGANGRARAPKRCAACAATQKHEERFWTPERIVEVFQEFARIFGRAPSTTDIYSFAYSPTIAANLSDARLAEVNDVTIAFAAHDLRLPSPPAVARELGSWKAAIAAAGLTPNPTGGAGHRRAT